MGYSSKYRPENNSSTDVPDFIDIKNFSDRCAILKNDIRLNKDSVSYFDSSLQKDTQHASVNPNLISKWADILTKHNLEKSGEVDDEDILPENSSLLSDTAKTEADLAKRIASSRLSTIDAFKLDNISSGSRNSKIGNFTPTFNSSVSLPGNVTERKLKPEPVSANDVILSISIFPGGKSAFLQSSHKQELEVKASDSLLAFTQGIYCLSERVAHDLIEEPSHSEVLESSSFLFIEGTFYDDEMDAKTHARPSDVYYQAMTAVSSNLSGTNSLISDTPAVKRASLEGTKWTDLKVRLNTPYLFVHLGGCEHIFSISSIRSANLSDEAELRLPRISQALRVRRRKCRICEVYAGTKMLINDKLMPENPCVICDKCYEGFHGSGQEWYDDFEIVPYYHEA